MTKSNKYISDSYENFFDNNLANTDPDLYNSIKLELEKIALSKIESSNLAFEQSVFTNKPFVNFPS